MIENPFELTMFYECVGTLPDGSVFQVQKSVVVQSEKEANSLIEEWNRIAKITKEVKYSYRRLS